MVVPNERPITLMPGVTLPLYLHARAFVGTRRGWIRHRSCRVVLDFVHARNQGADNVCHAALYRYIAILIPRRIRI